MPVPQLATKLRITKLMRPGISEDDVKSATEALKAAGRAVSIIAVREKLGGRGSYSTIKRHLDAWKTADLSTDGSTTEFPKELLASHSEGLTLIWHTAVAKAREMVAAELAEQARQNKEQQIALTEATEEIDLLERTVSARNDNLKDIDLKMRRLEDELVEVRTELTSTQAHSLEIKAALDSANERESRANERAETNAALLTESRNQLTAARTSLEEVITAKAEVEAKYAGLQAQIGIHLKTIEASRLRDEAAALELATIREKYAAIESDHQVKILELSMVTKTLHDLREGESELKDALAKSQSGEKEWRARLSADAERMAKMEANLEKVLAQITLPVSRDNPGER